MQKGIIYSALFALLFLTTATSFPSKDFHFTGKVVTKSGEVLIGASVLVKGSTNGVITDIDGNFKLTATDSCLTIVTTYIGFESNESTICSNGKLSIITLKEAGSLDEVVVLAMSPKAKRTSSIRYSSDAVSPTSPRHSREAKKRSKKIASKISMTKDVSTASFVPMDAEKPVKEEPRMTAGQLTAAEWNDLKNWDDWMDISKEDLGSWAKTWKLNPGSRYSAIIRNQDKTPLPNATIQLIDNKGNLVWQTLTDNTGRAELWLPSGKAGEIVVKYQDITERIHKISTFKKGINNIEIKTECPSVSDVEIVFAVDATGSMGDEISYLQAELMDVLSRLTATPIIDNLRTGAVFYRDHSDDYLVRKSDLTTDSKTTLTFIDNQSAGGGGDNPEAVEVGLEAAIEQIDWSEDAAARIVFFILDAPPHNTPAIQKKMKQLMKKAAQKGIRIIPMLASNAQGETEYIMRTLAIGTNGRLLFLTDDSGIGDPHAEPSVGPYRVEKANDLMFRLILEFAAFKPCQDDDNDPYQIANGDNDKLEVSCYPIPANDFILADLKTTADKVEILDAQGKIIMTQSDLPIGVTSIDIANLLPGSYFMKFTKGKKVETLTIVKAT